MVITGIALKELRAWAPGVAEEDITTAEAGCATAFGDDWTATPSLLQHVCVQLQHLGQMADEFVAGVTGVDKDAIDTAIDATTLEADHKEWLKGRVQLHWDDVVDAPNPEAVKVGPVTEDDIAVAEVAAPAEEEEEAPPAAE